MRNAIKGTKNAENTTKTNFRFKEYHLFYLVDLYFYYFIQLF